MKRAVISVVHPDAPHEPGVAVLVEERADGLFVRVPSHGNPDTADWFNPLESYAPYVQARVREAWGTPARAEADEATP